MSLWAFRFILWYICILMVQPQNRFTFLWPLRIAYLAFLVGAGLHIFSCLEERRPLLRLGPASILALCLIFFGTLSQFVGTYQISSSWNPGFDTLVKGAMLLLMVEAMAYTVERVWAVQMAALFATLWWVKGGLRLSGTGAVYAGDRIMGVAVSLIDNPNSFAYMMCIFLPLYLYAYQHVTKKWIKLLFLACALAAVYIVFETGSRTGMVTLIALGAFLLPRYGRRHFKTLVVVAVALVYIYPMTGEKNKERFRTIPQSVLSFIGLVEEKPKGSLTQDESSTEERKAKNKDTWGLIKENLIFGVGINPDQSQFVDRFPMAGGDVHCEILFAGKQMGLFGMGLYLGFLGVIFFGGRWIRQNATHWPAVRDLGWTFEVQAVALAVGGYFCPIVWHPPMMMLAGSASALVTILREEKERGAVRVARAG